MCLYNGYTLSYVRMQDSYGTLVKKPSLVGTKRHGLLMANNITNAAQVCYYDCLQT
jgi:hypothetical protein